MTPAQRELPGAWPTTYSEVSTVSEGSTSSTVSAVAGCIAVHCSGCGDLIPPGGGWVEVDSAAVRAVEDARRRHDQTVEQRRKAAGMPEGLTSLSWLIDYPAPVPWMAWHRACDPNIEAESYYIDVERISTWPQVVEWCAHLAEKTWIDSTGWWAVMRSLASGNDGILRAA